MVPEQIRKCVVFICYRDGTKTQVAGTGFFLGKPLGENRHCLGVITAQHVLNNIRHKSADQKVLLRVNLKNKPADFAASDLSQWRIHPYDAAADVAVLPAAPSPDVDYLAVPMSMAATSEIISKESIGPGDEVFITGLFVNHFGEERNIPILRIGNIAAMPEEKVKTDTMGPMDAFLIEARSIGGLSGSPVFVHLTGVRNNVFTVGPPPIYLLGLMHGHWDAEVTKNDSIQKDQFERERVNMGIAIVVPVQKIIETVDQFTTVQ